MSANETYQLAVQVRGEDIDETTEEMEDMEQSFDETSESVDESAGNMEGFAGRWQGAMTAIMAGLAIASAGLLSQVPVVGELMGGLEQVIAGVAYQMDNVLRPVLEPVADVFFGIADALFEAEGPMGALVGILGTMAVIFGIVFAVASALLAGMVALGWGLAFAAHHFGVLQEYLSILLMIFSPLLGLIALVASLLGVDLGNALQNVAGFFVNLISAAAGWGRDLMERFASGIADAASAPVDAVAGVFDGIVDSIGFDVRANDRWAEESGRDMMTHFGIGIRKGERHDLPTPTPESEEGRGRPATDSRDLRVLLDGKRVDRGIRPYRGDETAPRGRHS